MSNNNNIFVYLSYCNNCSSIMMDLQKYNLIINFDLSCADKNQQYWRNKGFSEVPIIIFKNTNTILVGEQCLKWMDGIKKVIDENNKKRISDSFNNINNTNYYEVSKNQARAPPLIGSNNNDTSENKLQGYNNTEMNGISDTYAFESEKNNNAFPKNFQPKNMNTEIFTPPVEKTKINKNEQLILTKKLEIIRNSDNSEFKKKIELEHEEILNRR